MAESAQLTHWKKLTNPAYLGAYSIEGGKDLILTISYVREEQVVGADGKKDNCVVCHWKEQQKPMILNSTNMKMITKLIGTPYIEQWAGHRIQIGIEKVKAFGDVVEALRVRKFLPRETAQKSIKCTECGADVSPQYGMSAEQLAAYTEKQFGKVLCAECATKLKEERDAQT